jgi:hypothetical protein
MDGERDAKIEVASLAGKQGLYVVGPIARLSGKTNIIGSTPTRASVGPDGAVQVRRSFDTGAPFLAWAEFSSWRDEDLPRDVRSIAGLEALLSRRAAGEGLGEAFPFLLEGEAANVDFHVVNADPERLHATSMQAHKEIEAHFETGRSGVTLVGFYSTTQQGVFVHRGALTHVHFDKRRHPAVRSCRRRRFRRGTICAVPARVSADYLGDGMRRHLEYKVHLCRCEFCGGAHHRMNGRSNNVGRRTRPRSKFDR